MHIVNQSEAVVVASGTAALECALLAKPMCIIYKVSLLSAVVVSQVIRVQYLGLCNLIAKRMIVPELIQEDCTPEAIAETLDGFLSNPLAAKALTNRLLQLKATLSQEHADKPIHELVHQLCAMGGCITDAPFPNLAGYRDIEALKSSHSFCVPTPVAAEI